MQLNFDLSLIREAAKGTKWEAFADIVLCNPLPNRYLFGDADPKVCAAALAITGRARFLALLGKFVIKGLFLYCLKWLTFYYRLNACLSFRWRHRAPNNDQGRSEKLRQLR